ncbi:MAG TPA: hypothetical protein ENI51_08495 [Candidatus Atribacteria bacterium]|nr:hypothetical protein [Candidatus Atribacteria bacterium]
MIVKNKSIKIRNAHFSNSREIAKIHKECLDKSFLATLGEKFLTLLYKTLVEHKKGILLVAEDNGKIIGFVSGITNTQAERDRKWKIKF